MSSRSHNRRSDRWRSKRRTRINIVPLIDVMFLLLCFFILVTMSMVVQHGMFVDLSTAESGESVKEIEDPAVISVEADGSVYYNKEKVTNEQLLKRLENLVKSREKPRVFLNADEEATHGSVVSTLDLVRKQGVSDVIFTVESKNP